VKQQPQADAVGAEQGVVGGTRQADTQNNTSRLHAMVMQAGSRKQMQLEQCSERSEFVALCVHG